MKRRGGAILGDGGYGVAFTPALVCDAYPVQQPGTIGKVYFNEAEADKAWKLTEVISKFDDGPEKYFSFPTVRCNVSLDEVLNQEPSIATLKSNLPPELQQQIMKHGGITLLEYLRTFYASKSSKLQIGRP